MLCILWINAQINLYYCRTWDHKAVNLAPFIKSKHSAISISKHRETTIGQDIVIVNSDPDWPCSEQAVVLAPAARQLHGARRHRGGGRLHRWQQNLAITRAFFSTVFVIWLTPLYTQAAWWWWSSSCSSPSTASAGSGSSGPRSSTLTGWAETRVTRGLWHVAGDHLRWKFNFHRKWLVCGIR